MVRRLFVLVLLMLVTESVGFAQDRSADTRLVQTTPGGCELNAAALDSIRNEALDEVRSDRVVIVIARLGNGEQSAFIIGGDCLLSRTISAGTACPRRGSSPAEGERMSGDGQVELYVDGRLPNRAFS